jgi:hypothetical protein
MKRGGKVAIGVAIGVVAAVLITWPISASAESHAVIVTTDAKPFSCADSASLTDWKFGTRWVPAVYLTPKLDCNLHIRVYNDGILPAEITSAYFENMGPYSDFAHVDIIDGLQSHGAEDAVGNLQNPRTLAPGEVMVLVVHLVEPKVPCMAPGSADGISASPEMGVTVLGIGVPRTPTDANFGYVGTKQSESPKCGDGEEIPLNPYDRD